MSKQKSALSHPSFFNKYVEMVGESGIIELLTHSYNNLIQDLKDLEKYNFEFSYAEKKWTITTLIRHCIDTEIIFLSRALSLARNDPKPIRSFDENQYAVESMAEYDKSALVEEFLHARKSSMLLYKSFQEEWISNRKSKNEDGEPISLLSIGYIIIGHWLHHKKVLEQQYGIQFSS